MSIEKIERWLRDQIEFPNGEVTLSEAEARALLDELSRLREALESAHKGLKAGCDQYAVKSIGEVEIPGDEQYPWVRLMQIGRDAAARVLSEREGQE